MQQTDFARPGSAANLTFFPAAHPNKTGVLVLPGGSYSGVASGIEGVPPAHWLIAHGFDAWVLEYTTASTAPPPLHPAPLDDALAAVRWVRAQGRAARLGIWGWSAGGHCAALAATDVSGGLDFAVLCYPVISLEPGTTHAETRSNLLGPDPYPELQRALGAHARVTAATPPTFLFHTADDDAVPVQNTLLFATALADHAVDFQLVVRPHGPHGSGLGLDRPNRSWTNELDRWLQQFVDPAHHGTFTVLDTGV